MGARTGGATIELGNWVGAPLTKLASSWRNSVRRAIPTIPPASWTTTRMVNMYLSGSGCPSAAAGEPSNLIEPGNSAATWDRGTRASTPVRTPDPVPLDTTRQADWAGASPCATCTS